MEPGIDEKQNADDIFLNVIDTNLSLAKGFFERIEELESEREQESDADLDVELSMLRLNFIQCLEDISHHAQALKSRIQSQPTIWENGLKPLETE